ncbi:hypothetical protein KFE25_003122 [Diacronema lutheri]|uniref:Uncharacterized protein n=1 Tax=Diacronema lutheri TaxID=2081491 RepID=A0A8J5XJB2_DIALT|nr:hypothetical protein KFE25_003122 [Diacronema lutheri]
MVGAMPKSPVFPGDTFTVNFVANTGGFALTGWSLTVSYDASTLSYQSTSASPLFSSPTVNAASVGTISVVTSGLSTGTTNADVTSSTLSLITFTLQVLVSVTPGSHVANAVSAVVDQMINSGLAIYVSNAAVSMTDAFDGTSPAGGDLLVDTLSTVGRFAYVARGELVNMAPLTGAPVATALSIVELYSRAATSNAILTAGYTCAAEDEAVLEILAGSPCTVQATSAASAGAASTAVTVTHSATGALVATVPLRVWFPLDASVRVPYSTLYRIQGLQLASSCGSPGFQSAFVSAVASFGGDGLATISLVDVTNQVTLVSSDSTIAILSTSATLGLVTVTGLSAGRVVVSLSGSSPTVSREIFVVADEIVRRVDSLVPVAFTQASFGAGPPSTFELGADVQFDANVVLAQTLVAEGDVASIYAYAYLGDGSYELVPSDQLTVSSRTSSLSVANPGAVTAPWTAAVAFGASSATGQLLDVHWTVCSTQVASARAKVVVNLPAPTSVAIVASVNRVAPPDDAASLSPSPLATSFAVTVTVGYADQSTRDFTLDSRANVTLVGGSDACASFDGMRTVTVLSGSKGVCSSVLVQADLSLYGLTDTVAVTLVTLDSLALSFSPSPAYLGSSAVGVTTLSRLGESSDYQQATAAVLATLSDGTSKWVQPHVTLSSNATGVVSVIGLVISGVAPGVALLIADWGGLASASAEIVALDAAVLLSSVLLTALGNSVGPVSLAGEQFATFVLGARVSFTDGRVLDDVVSSTAANVTALLGFASDDTSVVSVSASGVLTLVGNGVGLTTLTANSLDAGAVANTLTVAGNLDPAKGDFDLGQQAGLQYVQAGSIFTVPVRVNTGGALIAIQNFQLELSFDDAVLLATSCTPSVSWAVCTTNDPVNHVLLVGNTDSTATVGTAAQLATITFAVQSTGSTTIGGTIVELVTNENGATRIQDATMLAGAGVIVATGSRRALREARLAGIAPLATARRRLQTCGGCSEGIVGDVDGDCAFTSFDVRVLSEYVANLGPSVCASQLDATLDGAVTGQDALYLLYAVAGKLRFLTSYNVTEVPTVGTANPLTASIALTAHTNVPSDDSRTDVYFEISMDGVEHTPIYLAGSSSDRVSTNGFWVANALFDAGSFVVSVYPASGWPPLSRHIGIAVVVETKDAFGAQDEQRRFPFLGSSIEPYASLAFTFQALLSLRDAAGRTRVLATSLSTQLLISTTGGLLAKSVCAAANSVSGVGECATSVPSSWFSTSAPTTLSVIVEVRYASVFVVSALAPATTVLAQVPVHPPLSAAGVRIVAARSERFAGDTFSATAYAHTGGFALKSFKLSVSFDSAVLSLVSVVSSSSYATPVTNSGAVGQIGILVSGVNAAVTDAAVTGDAVELFTLTFVIGGALAAGSYANVLSAVADELLNSVGFRFVESAPAQMEDARGGAQPSVQLVVSRPVLVGVFGHVSTTGDSVRRNLAPLSAVADSTTLSATFLYSRANTELSPSTARGVDFTCALASADAAALSVSAACDIVADATRTRGAAAIVTLSAAGSAVSTSVPIRVWFPQEASVVVSAADLRPIANVSRRAAGGACTGDSSDEALLDLAPAYRRARVRVIAHFSYDGSINGTGSSRALGFTDGLDVTRFVTLQVADGAIAALTVDSAAGIVHVSGALGGSEGTTSVVVASAADPAFATAALINVGGSALDVLSVAIVALTAASWAVAPAGAALAFGATLSPVVSLAQTLDSEGDSAKLYAWAHLADGSAEPVPHAELQLASSTASLELQRNGADPDGAWMATVALNAVAQSGALIAGTWRACGAAAAGSGAALLHLALPAFVSLAVSADSARVTDPLDAAAAAPSSIPSFTSLSAIASFADGTSVDFSTDSRVNFTLAHADGSSACASLTGNVLTVNAGAVASGTCPSSLTVLVRIDVYGGAQSVTVPLVSFERLDVSALPFPSYAGAATRSSLSRISCLAAPAYQRASLVASATLSDGSVVGVSASASFSSSLAAVATVDGTSRTLRPLSAGTTAVSATWAGTSSAAPLSVTVTDVPVEPSSLALSSASGAGAFDLAGAIGATTGLQVGVTFSDGTVWTDVGALVNWVDVADLFDFASADPSAVAVSANGALTLLANAPVAIAVSAAWRCSPASVGAGSVSVRPNLAPAYADIDLGAASGLQFVQSGSTLSVAVRANTGASARLVNFQVEVALDATLLRASACTIPAALSGATCTMNDPVNRVRLVMDSAASTATGTALALATIVFDVIGAGDATFAGTLVEFITVSDAGVEVRTQDAAIVAGAGVARLAARRRLDELAPDAPLERALAARAAAALAGARAAEGARASAQPRRRRLSTCDPCTARVYGDVSGDCAFTSFDVRVASLVALNSSSYDPRSWCAWRRSQLDPTLDGAVTTGDASYLLLAVAGKRRFVNAALSAFAHTGDFDGSTVGAHVTVRFALVDDSGEPSTAPRTAVRFEVRFAEGALSGQGEVNASIGTVEAAPSAAGNWLLAAQLSAAGGGVWEAAFRPAAALSNGGTWPVAGSLHVAAMVETVDALGGSDSDRQFPFLGATASPYFEGGPPPSPTPPPPLPTFAGKAYDGYLAGCALSLGSAPPFATTADFGNFEVSGLWADLFGQTLTINTAALPCVDESTGLPIAAPLMTKITAPSPVSVTVTPLTTVLVELGRDTHRLDADVALALGLEPSAFADGGSASFLLASDLFVSLWTQDTHRQSAASLAALNAAMTTTAEVLAGAIAPRDASTGAVGGVALRQAASAVFGAIAAEVQARIDAAAGGALALSGNETVRAVIVRAIDLLPSRGVPVSTGLADDAAMLDAAAASVAHASARVEAAALALGAVGAGADVRALLVTLGQLQAASATALANALADVANGELSLAEALASTALGASNFDVAAAVTIVPQPRPEGDYAPFAPPSAPPPRPPPSPPGSPAPPPPIETLLGVAHAAASPGANARARALAADLAALDARTPPPVAIGVATELLELTFSGQGLLARGDSSGAVHYDVAAWTAANGTGACEPAVLGLPPTPLANGSATVGFASLAPRAPPLDGSAPTVNALGADNATLATPAALSLCFAFARDVALAARAQLAASAEGRPVTPADFAAARDGVGAAGPPLNDAAIGALLDGMSVEARYNLSAAVGAIAHAPTLVLGVAARAPAPPAPPPPGPRFDVSGAPVTISPPTPSYGGFLLAIVCVALLVADVLLLLLARSRHRARVHGEGGADGAPGGRKAAATTHPDGGVDGGSSPPLSTHRPLASELALTADTAAIGGGARGTDATGSGGVTGGRAAGADAGADRSTAPAAWRLFLAHHALVNALRTRQGYPALSDDVADGALTPAEAVHALGAQLALLLLAVVAWDETAAAGGRAAPSTLGVGMAVAARAGVLAAAIAHPFGWLARVGFGLAARAARRAELLRRAGELSEGNVAALVAASPPPLPPAGTAGAADDEDMRSALSDKSRVLKLAAAPPAPPQRTAAGTMLTLAPPSVGPRGGALVQLPLPSDRVSIAARRAELVAGCASALQPIRPLVEPPRAAVADFISPPRALGMTFEPEAQVLGAALAPGGVITASAQALPEPSMAYCSDDRFAELPFETRLRVKTRHEPKSRNKPRLPAVDAAALQRTGRVALPAEIAAGGLALPTELPPAPRRASRAGQLPPPPAARARVAAGGALPLPLPATAAPRNTPVAGAPACPSPLDFAAACAPPALPVPAGARCAALGALPSAALAGAARQSAIAAATARRAAAAGAGVQSSAASPGASPLSAAEAAAAAIAARAPRVAGLSDMLPPRSPVVAGGVTLPPSSSRAPSRRPASRGALMPPAAAGAPSAGAGGGTSDGDPPATPLLPGGSRCSAPRPRKPTAPRTPACADEQDGDGESAEPRRRFNAQPFDLFATPAFAGLSATGGPADADTLRARSSSLLAPAGGARGRPISAGRVGLPAAPAPDGAPPPAAPAPDRAAGEAAGAAARLRAGRVALPPQPPPADPPPSPPPSPPRSPTPAAGGARRGGGDGREGAPPLPLSPWRAYKVERDTAPRAAAGDDEPQPAAAADACAPRQAFAAPAAPSSAAVALLPAGALPLASALPPTATGGRGGYRGRVHVPAAATPGAMAPSACACARAAGASSADVQFAASRPGSAAMRVRAGSRGVRIAVGPDGGALVGAAGAASVLLPMRRTLSACGQVVPVPLARERVGVSGARATRPASATSRAAVAGADGDACHPTGALEHFQSERVGPAGVGASGLAAAALPGAWGADAPFAILGVCPPPTPPDLRALRNSVIRVESPGGRVSSSDPTAAGAAGRARSRSGSRADAGGASATPRLALATPRSPDGVGARDSHLDGSRSVRVSAAVGDQPVRSMAEGGATVRIANVRGLEGALARQRPPPPPPEGTDTAAALGTRASATSQPGVRGVRAADASPGFCALPRAATPADGVPRVRAVVRASGVRPSSRAAASRYARPVTASSNACADDEDGDADFEGKLDPVPAAFASQLPSASPTPTIRMSAAELDADHADGAAAGDGVRRQQRALRASRASADAAGSPSDVPGAPASEAKGGLPAKRASHAPPTRGALLAWLYTSAYLIAALGGALGIRAASSREWSDAQLRNVLLAWAVAAVAELCALQPFVLACALPLLLRGARRAVVQVAPN